MGVGFRMNKKQWAQSDTHLFILIHIFLTTLLLYFVFSGGGCEKKEELGETDPGPEIAIEQVAQAYFKATESPRQDFIKANFTTVYEVNQRVELGPSLKFIDFVRRVKCILREGTKTKIAISQETYLYDQYGNVIERRPAVDIILETRNLETTGLPEQEGDQCPILKELNTNNTTIVDPIILKTVNKIKGYQPHMNQPMALAIAQSLKEFHQRSEDLETLTKDVIKITLHNLVVESLSLSPPTKVQEKPNCNDIQNCVFNAQQIQFDIVEWYSATDFRKTRSRWVVTSQLPSFPEGMFDGFGGFISKCESGFQAIVVDDENGNPVEQEYLITTCPEVLRNF